MGNREEATKRMEMGTPYAGKTFRDLLGHISEEITIAEDGWAEFRCPAGGVSVWVAV
jgi:alpha-amylase